MENEKPKTKKSTPSGSEGNIVENENAKWYDGWFSYPYNAIPLAIIIILLILDILTWG